jgi:hypothetical protein
MFPIIGGGNIYTCKSLFAPAVIGPWPLGPAVNDLGATKPPRLFGCRPVADRLGCIRRSPSGPGMPPTCRSPAGRVLTCQSGKWFAMFNHICTRTSRATRCGSGPASDRRGLVVFGQKGYDFTARGAHRCSEHSCRPKRPSPFALRLRASGTTMVSCPCHKRYLRRLLSTRPSGPACTPAAKLGIPREYLIGVKGNAEDS